MDQLISDFTQFPKYFNSDVSSSFSPMIISVILSFFLILIGLRQIKTRAKNTIQVIAQVTDPQCQSQKLKPNKPKEFYTCTLKVTYVVNNEEYNSAIPYSGEKNYQAGNTLILYYDPVNPQNVSLKPDAVKLTGSVTILIGLGLAAVGLLNYFLSTSQIPDNTQRLLISCLFTGIVLILLIGGTYLIS